MKRTVTVLQDDIDQGVRVDTGRCPIARAVRRDLADLISGGNQVRVEDTRLDITSGDGLFTVARGRLPRTAQTFVSDFDEEQPVESFKFEIEIELS